MNRGNNNGVPAAREKRKRVVTLSHRKTQLHASNSASHSPSPLLSSPLNSPPQTSRGGITNHFQTESNHSHGISQKNTETPSKAHHSTKLFPPPQKQSSHSPSTIKLSLHHPSQKSLHLPPNNAPPQKHKPSYKDRDWSFPFSFDSQFVNPTTSRASSLAPVHVNCPRCAHEFVAHVNLIDNIIMDDGMTPYSPEDPSESLAIYQHLLTAHRKQQEKLQILKKLQLLDKDQQQPPNKPSLYKNHASQESTAKFHLSHSTDTEMTLLQDFNLDKDYQLCFDFMDGSALIFGGGQSMIFCLKRKQKKKRAPSFASQKHLSGVVPPPAVDEQRFALKVYASTVHPSLSLTEIDILSSMNGKTEYVPTVYELEAHWDYGVYQHAIVVEYIEHISMVHVFFSSTMITVEDLEEGQLISQLAALGVSSDEKRKQSHLFPQMDSFTQNFMKQQKSSLGEKPMARFADVRSDRDSEKLRSNPVPPIFVPTLPFNLLKVYMYKLLTALSHIHREGVIHRDIKPPNILFHPDTEKLRIIDFAGSVKAYPHSSRFMQHFKRREYYSPKTIFARHSYYGTLGFMAPETVLGIGIMTCAVDVWAAGVIFLSVLAQKLPVFLPQQDESFLAELICYLDAKDDLLELASCYGVKLGINGDEANKVTEEAYEDGSTPEGKHSHSPSIVRVRKTSSGRELQTHSTRERTQVIRSFCESSRQHLIESLEARTGKGAVRSAQDLQKPGSLLFNVPAQEWEQAYDLAARLLTINPERRIRAEDALKHPFFRSMCESG